MAVPGYSPLAAAYPPALDAPFPSAVEAAFEEICEVVIEIAQVAYYADPGRAPVVPLLQPRLIVAGIPQGIESSDLLSKDKAVPPTPPQIGGSLMLEVLEKDGATAQVGEPLLVEGSP